MGYTGTRRQREMSALGRVAIKSCLWDAFVRVAGANHEKKRVLRQFLPRPGRILEIGCATGNLAGIFGEFDYVGIDTDRQCIELAVRRHSGPNYRFYCLDILEEQLPDNPSFDYVLISHTLHHLHDDYARRLVQRGCELLVSGGTLLVLDMIRPNPEEPFRKQFYYWLDRGEHFRDLEEMLSLFKGASGFRSVDFHVAKTKKLGIEVIDQVVVQAKKAAA
jgi:SAM-dependent methyltransferase